MLYQYYNRNVELNVQDGVKSSANFTQNHLRLIVRIQAWVRGMIDRRRVNKLRNEMFGNSQSRTGQPVTEDYYNHNV